MTTQQHMVGGRYAVLGEIGRGGMGVVWRAQDTVIGRQVAVKEVRLPDGVPAHQRAVFDERVLREVRSAGRLNDPGVITVHDVLNESGATYIVMELVEAPTLSDVVRNGGPLPAAKVIDIAERVLAALEAAHAAGIVHRDVKPSNILVPANGRVKLTDFGIAQAVDDPKLTTTGTLIGSPAYLAPERVHGGAATPASDMWALGAVLFFAAEGYPLHERQTTAATLHAVVSERPVLRNCRDALASVITGLLIADPDTRLTAAQTRTLLRVPDGATVPVTPTGNPISPMYGTALYSAPAPVRRRTRPALRWTVAVLAVVLLAGAVAAGFGWGHRSAEAGRTPSNQQPTLTYGASDAQLAEFGLPNNSCGNGRIAAGNHFTSGDNTDCSGQHDFQVFESWPAISDNDNHATNYPDQTVLKRDAETGCTIVFQSSWITPGDKQNYNYLALVPSPDAWDTTPSDNGNDSKTRDILCVLWKADGGKLTGSAVASGN